MRDIHNNDISNNTVKQNEQANTHKQNLNQSKQDPVHHDDMKPVTT